MWDIKVIKYTLSLYSSRIFGIPVTAHEDSKTLFEYSKNTFYSEDLYSKHTDLKILLNDI